jgi:predicted ATP-grasp superfamily ATP-dependent carboligase
MSQTTNNCSVVVVGLCPHGLSMIRALRESGISVVALESDPTLPGVRTNAATVRLVESIHGVRLIEELHDLRRATAFDGDPVLLLTNDRQVEVVANDIARVSKDYIVRWAESAAHVLRLQCKDKIETRCADVGLNYPQSLVVSDFDALEEAIAGFRTPVILKPTRPLSGFKTLVIRSRTSLDAARRIIAGSMPVVAQEYIEGPEENIRFGALYLDRGEVIARFEGKKLRSRPMGHTTVAMPEPNDEVHAVTRRFFEGLEMSGFASLEMKSDQDRRQWVIEPTVGRSDFWVGICVANGVNFPLIEVLGGAGSPIGAVGRRRIWVNEERDPSAMPWLLAHYPSIFVRHGVVGVMVDARDPGPMFRALGAYLRRLPGRIAGRVGRTVGSTSRGPGTCP